MSQSAKRASTTKKSASSTADKKSATPAKKDAAGRKSSAATEPLNTAASARVPLVGRRFLSVTGVGPLRLSKMYDWDWHAGWIRAVTSNDYKDPDLQVLLEFDDQSWRDREWYLVHKHFKADEDSEDKDLEAEDKPKQAAASSSGAANKSSSKLTKTKKKKRRRKRKKESLDTSSDELSSEDEGSDNEADLEDDPSFEVKPGEAGGGSSKRPSAVGKKSGAKKSTTAGPTSDTTPTGSGTKTDLDQERFQVFFVEDRLTVTHRPNSQGSSSNSGTLYPALAYRPVVDLVGMFNTKKLPVEFISDKKLIFQEYTHLRTIKEWDPTIPGLVVSDRSKMEVESWLEQEAGQHILLNTPTVLLGYRVEVYRAEGTTQWYTAVIVGYNQQTEELTLTDDTVLEEHNEDPTKVQMRILGEGVIESILGGKTTCISARRSRASVFRSPTVSMRCADVLEDDSDPRSQRLRRTDKFSPHRGDTSKRLKSNVPANKKLKKPGTTVSKKLKSEVSAGQKYLKKFKRLKQKGLLVEKSSSPDLAPDSPPAASSEAKRARRRKRATPNYKESFSADEDDLGLADPTAFSTGLEEQNNNDDCQQPAAAAAPSSVRIRHSNSAASKSPASSEAVSGHSLTGSSSVLGSRPRGSQSGRAPGSSHAADKRKSPSVLLSNTGTGFLVGGNNAKKESDSDSDSRSSAKSSGSLSSRHHHHVVSSRVLKKSSFKGKAIAIVKPFSSLSSHKKSPQHNTASTNLSSSPTPAADNSRARDNNGLRRLADKNNEDSDLYDFKSDDSDGLQRLSKQSPLSCGGKNLVEDDLSLFKERERRLGGSNNNQQQSGTKPKAGGKQNSPSSQVLPDKSPVSRSSSAIVGQVVLKKLKLPGVRNGPQRIRPVQVRLDKLLPSTTKKSTTTPAKNAVTTAADNDSVEEPTEPRLGSSKKFAPTTDADSSTNSLSKKNQTSGNKEAPADSWPKISAQKREKTSDKAAKEAQSAEGESESDRKVEIEKRRSLTCENPRRDADRDPKKADSGTVKTERKSANEDSSSHEDDKSENGPVDPVKSEHVKRETDEGAVTPSEAVTASCEVNSCDDVKSSPRRSSDSFDDIQQLCPYSGKLVYGSDRCGTKNCHDSDDNSEPPATPTADISVVKAERDAEDSFDVGAKVRQAALKLEPTDDKEVKPTLESHEVSKEEPKTDDCAAGGHEKPVLPVKSEQREFKERSGTGEPSASRTSQETDTKEVTSTIASVTGGEGRSDSRNAGIVRPVPPYSSGNVGTKDKVAASANSGQDRTRIKMEEDARSDSGISTLRSDGARSSGDERSGSRSSALSDERSGSRPSASVSAEPDIKIVGTVPGRSTPAHLHYPSHILAGDKSQLAHVSSRDGKHVSSAADVPHHASRRSSHAADYHHPARDQREQQAAAIRREQEALLTRHFREAASRGSGASPTAAMADPRNPLGLPPGLNSQSLQALYNQSAAQYRPDLLTQQALYLATANSLGLSPEEILKQQYGNLAASHLAMERDRHFLAMERERQIAHDRDRQLREKKEQEQRERERLDKERYERDRLDKERYERERREKEERERREKQAQEDVNRHFQLSMEIVRKIPPHLLMSHNQRSSGHWPPSNSGLLHSIGSASASLPPPSGGSSKEATVAAELERRHHHQQQQQYLAERELRERRHASVDHYSTGGGNRHAVTNDVVLMEHHHRGGGSSGGSSHHHYPPGAGSAASSRGGIPSPLGPPATTASAGSSAHHHSRSLQQHHSSSNSQQHLDQLAAVHNLAVQHSAAQHAAAAAAAAAAHHAGGSRPSSGVLSPSAAHHPHHLAPPSAAAAGGDRSSQRASPSSGGRPRSVSPHTGRPLSATSHHPRLHSPHGALGSMVGAAPPHHHLSASSQRHHPSVVSPPPASHERYLPPQHSSSAAGGYSKLSGPHHDAVGGHHASKVGAPHHPHHPASMSHHHHPAGHQDRVSAHAQQSAPYPPSSARLKSAPSPQPAAGGAYPGGRPQHPGEPSSHHPHHHSLPAAHHHRPPSGGGDHHQRGVSPSALSAAAAHHHHQQQQLAAHRPPSRGGAPLSGPPPPPPAHGSSPWHSNKPILPPRGSPSAAGAHPPPPAARASPYNLSHSSGPPSTGEGIDVIPLDLGSSKRKLEAVEDGQRTSEQAENLTSASQPKSMRVDAPQEPQQLDLSAKPKPEPTQAPSPCDLSVAASGTAASAESADKQQEPVQESVGATTRESGTPNLPGDDAGASLKSEEAPSKNDSPAPVTEPSGVSDPKGGTSSAAPPSKEYVGGYVHKLKKAWIKSYNDPTAPSDSLPSGNNNGSNTSSTTSPQLTRATPSPAGSNKSSGSGVSGKGGGFPNAVKSAAEALTRMNGHFHRGRANKGGDDDDLNGGDDMSSADELGDEEDSHQSKPTVSGSKSKSKKGKPGPKPKGRPGPKPRGAGRKGGSGSGSSAVTSKQQMDSDSYNSESEKESDSSKASSRKSESASVGGGKKRGRKPLKNGNKSKDYSSVSNGVAGEPKVKKLKIDLSSNGIVASATMANSSGGKSVAAADPFARPSISQLKKTGDSFLQDASCFEVAPKLAKCRECRGSHAQRQKQSLANIFCRFYAFRRLRYTKNGQIAQAGFCDPKQDAQIDDLKLWLPSQDLSPTNMDKDTAKIILRHLSEQFYTIYRQEEEAAAIHMSEDLTVAWKRVVQGVREMCDVCEATLFNKHWACGKCGFVACIDCYRARAAKQEEEEAARRRRRQKDREDGGGLNSASSRSGDGGVGSYSDGLDDDFDECSNSSMKSTAGLNSTDRDGYSWLYCTNRHPHEPDTMMLTQIIAGDALDEVNSKLRLMAKLHRKQEGGLALVNGWKNESAAPKQHNGIKNETLIKEEEEDTANLRDLLDSCPGGTSRLASDYSWGPTNSQPITMTDEESRRLFPTHCSHAWLCNGGVLRLDDHREAQNLEIFKHVWPHGHPVLVAGIGDALDPGLWQPETFRDLPDAGFDPANPEATSAVSHGQTLKRFFDGFTTSGDEAKQRGSSNRQQLDEAEHEAKDKAGDSVNVLRLRENWPVGEDQFLELVPNHYRDIMINLPLPEYLERDGVLNLSARLPECFVRLDLGPRMWGGYSRAVYNLQYNVCDALHVCVATGNDFQTGSNNRNLGDYLSSAGCVDNLERFLASSRTSTTASSQPRVAAVWQVWHPNAADKLKSFVKRHMKSGDQFKMVGSGKPRDPLYEQAMFLKDRLIEKLVDEARKEEEASAANSGAEDVKSDPDGNSSVDDTFSGGSSSKESKKSKKRAKTGGSSTGQTNGSSARDSHLVNGGQAPLAHSFFRPWTFYQCEGEGVIIPAGAPYQVRLVNASLMVQTEFISPEHVDRSMRLCFGSNSSGSLLSPAPADDGSNVALLHHYNLDDRLQMKNVIFHSCKDALSVLQKPELTDELPSHQSRGANAAKK